MKRALFIDLVAESERGWKNGELIEMQFQFVEISEVAAFGQLLVARIHDSKFRFDHAVMVLVSDPDHQRGLAIQGPDHHRSAKDDPRDWSSETDENQSSHDRDQEYSGHDLKRADEMPVKCLRIHVAVTDRGQRLYTEEETIEKPAGAGSSGHAVRVDAIKNGEQKIQAEVNSTDESGELWPVQSEQPTVDIAPFPSVGINLDELDRAGAD